MVNDQITEVNGTSLSGRSNQEAVDILKKTGDVVHLTIVRYLRGLKFEELQVSTSPIFWFVLGLETAKLLILRRHSLWTAPKGANARTALWNTVNLDKISDLILQTMQDQINYLITGRYQSGQRTDANFTLSSAEHSIFTNNGRSQFHRGSNSFVTGTVHTAQWCVFNNFSLDKHRHQIWDKFLLQF